MLRVTDWLGEQILDREAHVGPAHPPKEVSPWLLVPASG